MTTETITNLVRASGVTTGELILIHFWGEDADLDVAHAFTSAVAALGATPLLLQQSRTANRALFAAATDDSFGDRYFARFVDLDAVLDIFAYQPVTLGAEVEPETLTRYRRYMARLFGELMKCKRFTQLRLPTAANAAESDLAPDDYIARMNTAYAVDYAALHAACTAAIAPLRDAATVTLRTGRDCALRLTLAGRDWHIDAGDGDLPCGEVYIAPVEDRSEGAVYFDRIYLDGQRYDGVTMHFTAGRLDACDCPAVTAYFDALPDENRVLCELGLGMNEQVRDLCGYTVLDEKMAGTFHIALGANNMFGGMNQASDHIDFVGQGSVAAE